MELAILLLVEMINSKIKAFKWKRIVLYRKASFIYHKINKDIKIGRKTHIRKEYQIFYNIIQKTY